MRGISRTVLRTCNWWETGSENGTGTFTLDRHANFACPWWWGRWNPNAACHVFP